MAVPNTFASATASIPLANLDANFSYYDTAYSISGTTVTYNGTVNITGLTASKVVFTDASKNLTSTGIVPILNGGTGTSTPGLVAGTNVTISGTWPNQTINSTAGGGGGGTVTSVSVTSANGFAGTVTNATTTPAISVSTSITGVLKGNGTAISAAAAGTDYQAPITLTTTGTSGAATFVSNTLNIPQYTGGGGSSTLTISNKTAAYTVVAGDLGTVINCTSNTFTVSLTAAATLGTGFNVQIINTGTGVITIDPNGAETLDANTTWQLSKGQGVLILCDGTNFQTIAIRTSGQSANSVALGNNSGGTPSVAITGAGAMALGGSYASGVDSFAAAISDNTSTYGAQGANSIAIGYLAKATGNYSVVVGGRSTNATGTYSANLGGFNNTSSGQGSVILGGTGNGASNDYAGILGGSFNSASGSNTAIAGGSNNAASGIRSAVLGGNYGDTRSISGNIVSAASDVPIASAAGVSQLAMLVLAKETTNATATVLASNASAAAATNQIALPNNSAYYFRGEVIAGVTGAGNTKGWFIEGVIKRGANAAATSLVGTPTVTSNYADAGASAWAVAVTANTTLGCLTITVTGQAATTIRWVAQVRTTEMTY